MAVLDDNDPVCILSAKILQVLDKQDGATALAALASVLGTTIAYACSKTPARPPAALLAMREDCMNLVADIVRGREADKHARS